MLFSEILIRSPRALANAIVSLSLDYPTRVACKGELRSGCTSGLLPLAFAAQNPPLSAYSSNSHVHRETGFLFWK
jgi:hypothetical protein